MRVCWLTPDKPANISVGRDRIATHLRKRGIEVLVRGTTLGTSARMLRDRQGFDAVIGTTRAGALAGAVVAGTKRCPLIVDHVDPIRQFEQNASRPLGTLVRWAENAVFALAAHTLYVYPEERARVERFSTRTSKTDLGVEFDRFAEPAPEAVRAAESRLDEVGLTGPIAVYVGGLEPIYHIEELMASAEHLEDWTILVIGDGSLSELVERAASRNDRIEFLGSVPHEAVPGYLRAADVGVCLVDDPHTLKLLEYGAAGLPAVQLAGRAEKRFSGLVEFCTADPTDIARAIEGAQANGRAASDRTPSESLRAVARRHDWAQIAVEYERALERVTGQATPQRNGSQ